MESAWARWTVCLVLLIGGALGRIARAEVTVSAAISLKSTLEKAQPLLEKAAGEKISFNFGASGTLAGQVQQGAPVDLFLSADRPTIQKLIDAGAVDAGTDQVFASNELVLILTRVALDASRKPTGFADLGKARRIAIGDPRTVPAGSYARETLRALKVYDDLEKEGKFVTAENVGQVLTFVEHGDADAGFVYATDARAAGSQVEVVAPAPAGTHSRIEYVSGLVAGTKHREAAARAQRELLSVPVQAIFGEFGFTPAPVPATSAVSTAPEGRERDMIYLRPWLLSLEVAAIATAINALIGLPLSYLLGSRRFPLRWLVESLVMLPLVLPPTVVGFALMFVIGRSGLYGLLAHDTLQFTPFAAVLGSSVVSFPLLVLPLKAAFVATPREYHDEARMAGLSAVQRFLFVAIPLARGGILSGLLLCFARALGEFGATLMLLGTSERTRTLPIQIYYDAGQLSDYAAAWPAVVALACTSLVVIVLAHRLRWLEAEK